MGQLTRRSNSKFGKNTTPVFENIIMSYNNENKRPNKSLVPTRNYAVLILAKLSGRAAQCSRWAQINNGINNSNHYDNAIG